MYLQASVASSEYTDASEFDYEDDDSDDYDVSPRCSFYSIFWLIPNLSNTLIQPKAKVLGHEI